MDGFDLDESSIELARQNAREAGVDDRVTFQARDIAQAEHGQYDVGVIIEAVHDMTQPTEVLSALRRMLRPGGLVLVADEKTGDAFTAPADDLDRMYYGFSVFTCLPAAMAEVPTEALGTVLRADTMRRIASEAGFTSIDRLDTPELDMLRFYLMTP